MTHDQGLGKLGVKLLHQLAHRLHLGSGAGVPRETLVVETAFVAHTDAVAVVVLTVGAHHFQGATNLDGAVAANDEVVAATVFPTTGAMPAVDFAHAALLVRTHGAAVDDN